ncbi:MAG: cobalamin biosynthesis protein CbiG [Pseudomonadota bacterium]
MAAFDRYLIVDWSAANAPKKGKDSIWLAMADRGGALLAPENWATRAAAMERICALVRQCLADGYRLLVGFDFAFGYPRGAAARLSGEQDWRAVWAMLAERVVDARDNRNNSFELAGALNRDSFAPLSAGPFWGHPHQHVGRYPGLGFKKNRQAFAEIHEFRHVEKQAKGAKSVWQLAYNGTVGRQAMLGIAALQRLRTLSDIRPYCAIWPFETRFAADFSKPILVAEIYPSLFAVDAGEAEVRDAAQVRTVASAFAGYDNRDDLERLLARPATLTNDAVAEVLDEEGWIVGAGHAL